MSRNVVHGRKPYVVYGKTRGLRDKNPMAAGCRRYL